MKKKCRYQEVLKKQQIMHEISEKAITMLGDPDDLMKDYMYVIGPVLVSYVRWVLIEASKRGIEHLYFMARDGYAMFQIVNEIASKESLPFSYSYLHCSRYSLRIPQFHLDILAAIETLCLDSLDVTFHKIMNRTGILEKNDAEIAALLGFTDSMNQILSKNKLLELKKLMRESKEFQELLSQVSKEAYPDTVMYLKEQGFFEKRKNAIVDSGWVGSVQKTLHSLLTSKVPKIKLEGFYFGLYDLPERVSKDCYHAYFFTPQTGLKKKSFFCNSLFECICTSVEGMTIGYRDQVGTYAPILEETEHPNKEEIQLGICYLRHYCNCYFERINNIWDETNNDHIEMIEKLLFHFMARPTKEEAEIWGKRIFCDDVTSEQETELANILTMSEIRSFFFVAKAIKKLQGNINKTRESSWMEGSLRRVNNCPELWNWQIRMSRFTTYLLKMKGTQNRE